MFSHLFTFRSLVVNGIRDHIFLLSSLFPRVLTMFLFCPKIARPSGVLLQVVSTRLILRLAMGIMMLFVTARMAFAGM